ncbi:hypothetical protein V5799_029555 [Amblyomma americanum]|uniref:EB domain-containing protein n=1 Tax=Amblyomma americanum TaxID=6943 RepID=A0AAQ4ER02_AMBAM
MWPAACVFSWGVWVVLFVMAAGDALTVEDILLKGYSQLGQWCQTDSNCSVENSGCMAETCVCRLGYVLYEDRCIPVPRSSRGLSKVYLMSVGCLLSILIFSMSLCFLYWKRKLDDRRNMQAEDRPTAVVTPPSLCSGSSAVDKPPPYEDAVRPCFRFNLETAAPNSWHALPLSGDQVAINLPPPYREVMQHQKSLHRASI